MFGKREWTLDTTVMIDSNTDPFSHEAAVFDLVMFIHTVTAIMFTSLSLYFNLTEWRLSDYIH